jgi:hypothetical protein
MEGPLPTTFGLRFGSVASENKSPWEVISTNGKSATTTTTTNTSIIIIIIIIIIICNQFGGVIITKPNCVTGTNIMSDPDECLLCNFILCLQVTSTIKKLTENFNTFYPGFLF